jgi:ABC-type transporter Mla subunit MlaD
MTQTNTNGTMAPPSHAELGGRLQALVGQRDSAMNAVVIQSGEIQHLLEQLGGARQALAEKDAELVKVNARLAALQSAAANS